MYGYIRKTTQTDANAEPISKNYYYEWDGTTAAPTPLQTRPKDALLAHRNPPPPPPKGPVILQSTTLAIPALPENGTQKLLPAATVHPLFLSPAEAPKSSAARAAATVGRSVLIAPDAQKSYLLRDQSAVLYQWNGALFAVPLTQINAEKYVLTKKEAALHNAKAMGTAILMYTQDYNDVFPLANSANTVKPYMKDANAADGFVFQTPGTLLGLIRSPETTVMGFIAAPGGRAVVFVDGHVVWKEEP